MDIVSRLKQYMEYVGMPSTQFADKAEVARPTMSQILNGRNRKISNELLEKLHQAFPKLNIMWLLFGDGDIELDANNETSEPQIEPNLFSGFAETSTAQGFASTIASSQQKPIQLQNSNIEEFVKENVRTNHLKADHQESVNDNQAHTPVHGQDSNKTIKTIMVFYSDRSYQIFSPATT